MPQSSAEAKFTERPSTHFAVAGLPWTDGW